MKKFMLFMVGSVFAGIVSGASAQTCAQETEGKKLCIGGETMQCIKKFDASTKAFKFELEGVTAQGTAIDVSSPMYKKTPGYTPVACSGS